jgi:hypothetical protein
MRVYAAAHFARDDHLQMTWIDAQGILQSEYTGGESGMAYPVTMFGEVRGQAQSLDDAQNRLGGALGNVLPLVALASNAAIADPLPIAAFGLNVEDGPQELMWYAVPHANTYFPPGVRTINTQATLALLTAIGNHPQTVMLHRVVECYRRALENLVPERLVMAGEFLFMAAEALSRCLVETRAAAKNMTPKNLAQLQGESGPDALRKTYLRRDIFDQDEQALTALRAASDGFEHGYLHVNEVRRLFSEPMLLRAMKCIRRSIVRSSGLDAASEAIILGSDYEEPRGLVPPISFVRGDVELVDSSKPPPPDVGRLELDFPVPTPKAIDESHGQPVKIEFEHKITGLHVPENIKVNLRSKGLRAAHVKVPETDSLHPTSDSPSVSSD